MPNVTNYENTEDLAASDAANDLRSVGVPVANLLMAIGANMCMV